ncbi:MAG: hypothetical protein ACT4P6_09685 [Gemmatimonadaceae bacterium]
MSQSRKCWIGAVSAAALGVLVGCTDSPPAPSSVESTVDRVVQTAADRQDNGMQIPFAKLKLFLEFNSTDNDLGVQLLLDGNDWERIEGSDPRGRQIVEVETGGRLRQLGLTELFWESAEPSPEEVLGLIPAGNYAFSGKTVDGERLAGTATLSHNLPPAPQFSPSDGAVVDINSFVVMWKAIAGLASFQLIVFDELAGLELVADLRPSITSFRVPTEFLRRGAAYKIEVLAVAMNGNKTITEATVQTKP